MRIPFVDLKAQYQSIKNEVDPAISYIIENTQFVGGKKLETLEQNYAKYV